MTARASDTSGKILSLPALLRRRRAWARRGAWVVFANGVFDLLHPGHVELLEGARRLGGALVVGVNTDASVRRLGKGPGRPLNPLRRRLRVLAALACVDAVVAFGEDTPERLLARLKPDVLVKGADYRPEAVAGRRHAGRTVLLPLKPGCSTTALVARMRRAGR